MLSLPPVKTAKKSQFYFITLIYFAEFYKKREKTRKTAQTGKYRFPARAASINAYYSYKIAIKPKLCRNALEKFFDVRTFFHTDFTVDRNRAQTQRDSVGFEVVVAAGKNRREFVGTFLDRFFTVAALEAVLGGLEVEVAAEDLD